ncbi:MAG: phosphatase PAP2 family protein, partial [Chloroflexia bacterium]|nr:phosphatase PAP2 family protein [Chloroflexia bacterium]
MVSTMFAGSRTGIRTNERVERARHISFKTPALLLAMLTGVLLADAMIEPFAPFDLWGIKLIQSIDLPYLVTVIRPFDAMTSSIGAIATWTLLMAAFVVARKWLPALAMLALPIGGLINNFVSEVLVGRTRPHGYEEITRTVTNIEAASFPSGHVMGAVLLYGLIFFLAREVNNRWIALAMRSFSAMMIVVVGFARIWYGAHWPSDVLGAYALGGLLLVAILAAYQKVQSAVGDIPFIRAAFVRHDERRPHAHALTSLVIFNGNTVSKVYAPGFVPRALYWLAYQAEFPYI